MAHHQKHETDTRRRSSTFQTLLKIFNLSNAPTLTSEDEDVPGETDEPPDDTLAALTSVPQQGKLYNKFVAPKCTRRESLLTRAIMAGSRQPHEASPTSPLHSHRLRVSTATSEVSTGSMASTAELTSDCDLTSTTRSASPSPPLPQNAFANPFASRKTCEPPAKVLIAPATHDDKPEAADINEAVVEKTLGRKRCIMFACGGSPPAVKAPVPKQPENKSTDITFRLQDPPKRKCMLTFACPSRPDEEPKHTPQVTKPGLDPRRQRKPSPAPQSKRRLSADAGDANARATKNAAGNKMLSKATLPRVFYEFGSSHDETDTWADMPNTHKDKLTLEDCFRKENAIRRLGEEAEAEAQDEDEEEDELANQFEDENEDVDDFAPSDQESDGGNESDDEGGFASSDDESDAGSEYRFWNPASTTAATSVDNLHMSHFSVKQRSRHNSFESLSQSQSSRGCESNVRRHHSRRAPTKMRPGTPELPDSTDFVCGTLDEDRPLEAAYISCRKQRMLEKQILIPQDIDPSFPTSDFEQEDEDDSVDSSYEDHQLEELLHHKDSNVVVESSRGRKASADSNMSSKSPRHPMRPNLSRRGTNRSPPPAKHQRAHSPAPKRKLFGHSPAEMHSPPSAGRLRSPRGSPTAVPHGVAFHGLAQRPVMHRTSSLPRTPNPFFKRFNVGSPSISNVASGAITPGLDEEPIRFDAHVRGPVDIVIGLEKKRQKRREKYWRQHCRKAAKEHAGRKTVPGRGLVRMRELGLECAERNRGYGPAPQLVISL